MKVKSLSRVRPSATPWIAAFQAPPSMGFSRQEYWSGVPLPSLKEYIKAVYCQPAYLSAMLDESQAGIKTDRRNINNLRYAVDTTLMAESKEELKTLFMKVKAESEKAGLKLNIQKTKIIASGPITSRQTDGEKTVSDFIFLGSKITADSDLQPQNKRCLKKKL